MIKKLIIFVIFSFYVVSASAGSDSIEQFIEQWQEKNQIPAVSFLIKSPKSNIYYLSGTTTLNGNRKNRRPNIIWCWEYY